MKMFIRKKDLRYGVHVLLTVILSFAANVPRAAAETPTGPSPTRVVLEVVYDPESDLLSLEARHAALDKVLHEISEKARVTIDSPSKELLREQISIEINRVPLERALKQLLAGFNSTFFYSSTTSQQTATTPPTPRLDKVVLLSKKESRPVAPQVAKLQPSPSADQSGELVRALIEHKSTEARAMVQALKESGTDAERERAVDSLMNLLQDRNQDRQARIRAAALLGEIGDQRAVDLLMGTFNDADPGIQQTAASSLARIGGERGVRFLLQVFSGSDRNLHRSAAMALAFHGDDQAKAALTRAIGAGQVTADAIPKDVIDELGRRK